MFDSHFEYFKNQFKRNFIRKFREKVFVSFFFSAKVLLRVKIEDVDERVIIFGPDKLKKEGI
mgnify:CR=1 FL=1